MEDAYFVSHLISEYRIQEFTRIKLTYLKKTVSRINEITEGLAGKGFLFRTLREKIHLFKPVIPLAIPMALGYLLGLN